MKFLTRKKLFFFLAAAAIFSCAVPVGYKAFPYVHEKESYRSAIDIQTLQSKLESKVPAWMLEQIKDDVKDFKDYKITCESVEKTYQNICKKTGYRDGFYHYRVIDNKLYKFVPEEKSFSGSDFPLEKALKTLLIYTKVPDVDFILCTMDGLPEPYMPKDFYLMENRKDHRPLFLRRQN